MAPGKAPMDFRFFLILGCEVRFEIIQGVDLGSILFPHFECFLEQAILDFVQQLSDIRNDLIPWNTLFVFHALVTTSQEDGVTFDISGPHLHSERNSALDVLPILFAAS